MTGGREKSRWLCSERITEGDDMPRYGRFFSEDKKTKTKGANKLPPEVVARMLEKARIQARIDSLEEFLKYQDHTIPYELPVGEFAWHEARIKQQRLMGIIPGSKK